MGTIINEFESRAGGKKRKNTNVIPSPSHKAYLKKLKKGPSPKGKKSQKMTERLEKLEQRQEEMITKNEESSTKLYKMMESLLKNGECNQSRPKRTTPWSLEK